MAILAAEHGYAATRVTDVLQATGLSSRTFYAYFENREACFFAAYDAVAEDLEAMLGPAPDTGRSPELEPELRGVLDHFATWPAHARVLLVEIAAVGPRGAQRREQTMAMLSARLAECPQWRRRRCKPLERDEMAQAVIGAIVRIVELQLNSGQERALPRLLPSLTALTTRVGLAA